VADRTRLHHAVIQRVQETLFADPASTLHEFGMHDRDLPGQPAKTDEAEREPEAQRFAKTRCRWFVHMEVSAVGLQANDNPYGGQP
jgi:hypothetical protein